MSDLTALYDSLQPRVVLALCALVILALGGLLSLWTALRWIAWLMVRSWVRGAQVKPRDAKGRFVKKDKI